MLIHQFFLNVPGSSFIQLGRNASLEISTGARLFVFEVSINLGNKISFGVRALEQMQCKCYSYFQEHRQKSLTSIWLMWLANSGQDYIRAKFGLHVPFAKLHFLFIIFSGCRLWFRLGVIFVINRYSFCEC